jgi:hypothetical protein
LPTLLKCCVSLSFAYRIRLMLTIICVHEQLVLSFAGADAGKIFKRKHHSTTFVFIRCMSLPAWARSKSWAWTCVMVIEQDEPFTFDHIFRASLLPFFTQHDPGQAPDDGVPDSIYAHCAGLLFLRHVLRILQASRWATVFVTSL